MFACALKSLAMRYVVKSIVQEAHRSSLLLDCLHMAGGTMKEEKKGLKMKMCLMA